MNRDLTSRLEHFARAWRRAANRDPAVPRLAEFLAGVRAMQPPRPISRPRPEPDLVRLRTFFADAAGPLARRRAEGGVLNPWTAAGLKRNEVRNAAVLAALWSPQVCGDGAITFLDAFCRRLADPADRLPTSRELRAGYSVRREHCPVGEASERVDLTIEGRDFVLGVEVKIGADEGLEQLRRYVASIERWGRQRQKRAQVVFLSPHPPSVGELPHATWRDLAAAARVVLPRIGAGASFHDMLLDGFVRHISNFGE